MAYSWKKQGTINASQCGSTDSTNFPVTVALDGNVQAADTDLKTVGNGGFVQNANGFDIRPYSDAALTTALTFELVFFDGATGKVEMHVNIPTLSHTSDTVIYLAFGDSSISTDGSSNGTWDSNFQGVYHLKDGTTLSGNDSTATPANGTLVNTPTATAGQIDGAMNTVAASNQHISLGNPTKLQITGNLTIETWINITTEANSQIVTKDKDTGGRAYTFDYLGTSSKKNRLYINGGTSLILGNTALSTSTWYYIVGTYLSGGSAKLNLYLNGASDATEINAADGSIPSATANVLIARREYTGFEQNFGGKIDEVRISNSVRSADWILSTYNAQKASSTFITWGAKQATASSRAGTILRGGTFLGGTFR
jgi:hypothetical protein